MGFEPIIPDENPNPDSDVSESTSDDDWGTSDDWGSEVKNTTSSNFEESPNAENNSNTYEFEGQHKVQDSGFNVASDTNDFFEDTDVNKSSGSSSSNFDFEDSFNSGANGGSNMDNFNGQGSESSTSQMQSKAENKVSKINLGYKQVAILLAGVLLTIAILISVIYNVTAGKPSNTQASMQAPTTSTDASNTSTETQTPEPENTQGVGGTEASNNTTVGGTSASAASSQDTNTNNSDSQTDSLYADKMTTLTDGTFNYGEDMVADATVTDKTICVTASNSVTYRLSLRIGQATQDYSYYCNRKAYDSVQVGSMVSVTYSAIDNKYLAIVSVKQ